MYDKGTKIKNHKRQRNMTLTQDRIRGHVSHIFETTLVGEKTWIIVTEYPGRGLAIHSISDNVSILQGLKKPS